MAPCRVTKEITPWRRGRGEGGQNKAGHRVSAWRVSGWGQPPSRALPEVEDEVVRMGCIRMVDVRIGGGGEKKIRGIFEKWSLCIK